LNVCFSFAGQHCSNTSEPYTAAICAFKLLQVLLLGCGDVRNALTTAAALHKAGASSSCEVHLNDISDAVLARNALLLAAAANIDPQKAADVQFLWAVWFNATLSAEHKQRLDVLLQQVRFAAVVVLGGPIISTASRFLSVARWT
jgi:hypothetical protein